MSKLPPGLYDLPITNEIERELRQLDARRFGAEALELDPADADLAFARHLAAVVRQALADVRDENRVARQAEIVNELLGALEQRSKAVDRDDHLALPPRRLASVHSFDLGGRETRPADPLIPLAQSDLLVNARGEPSVGQAIQREIASADRIDLLCAFIKWHGLRLLDEPLDAYLRSGRTLRVITTTYVGATERKAIDRLVEMGAELKVSYQVDHTRLHAKAWLFHRDSGFSTAFIGSSNLSKSALLDGVEWNVRLSQIDAPTIVEKFAATFDSYWADPSFETYSAAEADRFDRAIGQALGKPEATVLVPFAIEPWTHQREMLDKLTVERYRHNRWRNLVVAATGTGKTVVAALDYKRLCEEIGNARPLKLLFVAHRREILDQSLVTFRHVLRDGAFGEKFVDGHRPDEWQHVFASVQSLQTIKLEDVARDAFDVVIVDEFHHAAAPTYRKLLEHFQPRVLLGLTATPERTDGESVLHWFGDRIAVELRLWDALERQLLAPFHYFGLHDSTDLAPIRWTRGAYDRAQLQGVYIADDSRIAQILAELQRKVTDVRRMRALGFCVGIEHAHYMARRFNEAGVPSLAVSSESTGEERDTALRKLKYREVNCLFAVDLFNEGVDVPEIDTVLFLRPTESATVFLQQLGRGLRRTSDKDCLTVLDFIGNANRNFRFDLRYRALTGATRAEVVAQVENGFPLLPAGCSIQLDRVARQLVLDNLRQAIGSRFTTLVRELQSIGRPVSLLEFTNEAAIDLEDVYRSRGWSWTRLQREAGLLGNAPAKTMQIADAPATRIADPRDEERLLIGVPRLLHIEDPERLGFLRMLLNAAFVSPDRLSVRERRILEGFLLTLTPEEVDVAAVLKTLERSEAVRKELREVLDVLEDRAEHQTFPLAETVPNAAFADVPLALHARYTRDEVLAALSLSTLAKPLSHREGPLRDRATNTDYFFITLEKSEKYYSPSTRYRRLRHRSGPLSLGVPVSDARKERTRPTLRPTRPTREPRHASRPPVQQGRMGPYTALHVPRPGDLCEPHRRAADGHRLAARSADAAGCVQSGKGGRRVAGRGSETFQSADPKGFNWPAHYLTISRTVPESLLYPRMVAQRLRESLADSPVVLIHGPRQSGKTTLARVVAEPLGFTYFTFDDDVLRASAEADPAGFVADMRQRAILDEVQRVPSLFAAIKSSVDRDRTAGRFILTGSANVLLVPKLSDSLAGRMEILRLHPLAQSELARRTPRFLDALFDAGFKTGSTKRLGSDLAIRIAAGGYPAALARPTARRQAAWYRDYVEALVERDVRDLARISALDAMPRLLSLAASQTGRLLNISEIAAPFEVSRPTIRDYVTLLERVFLLETVPPWHTNRISRMVKAPKVHLGDTGLACALLGVNAEALMEDRQLLGQMLETFVFQELRREASARDETLHFFHFRDKDGAEVDVVIERGARAVAGIEVKASATVTAADFRGLRKLKEASGKRFAAGVVLYDGETSARFDDRLFAVPVRALWET